MAEKSSFLKNVLEPFLSPRKIIPPLHAAMEELLKVVDNDTNAFSEYMVDNIRITAILNIIIITITNSTQPDCYEAAQEQPRRAGSTGGGHAGFQF